MIDDAHHVSITPNLYLKPHLCWIYLSYLSPFGLYVLETRLPKRKTRVALFTANAFSVVTQSLNICCQDAMTAYCSRYFALSWMYLWTSNKSKKLLASSAKIARKALTRQGAYLQHQTMRLFLNIYREVNINITTWENKSALI